MALTTEETARLAALRTAYDALITGKAVAKAQVAGRMVEYSQASKDDLFREISGLQAKQAAGCGRTRGALRFTV